MFDFINHHNLPKDLLLPQGNMSLDKALSCILDVMAHSLGKEKRQQLIQELEKYKEGLPVDVR